MVPTPVGLLLLVVVVGKAAATRQNRQQTLDNAGLGLPQAGVPKATAVEGSTSIHPGTCSRGSRGPNSGQMAAKRQSLWCAARNGLVQQAVCRSCCSCCATMQAAWTMRW
jgi:hypothetical protein